MANHESPRQNFGRAASVRRIFTPNTGMLNHVVTSADFEKNNSDFVSPFNGSAGLIYSTQHSLLVGEKWFSAVLNFSSIFSLYFWRYIICCRIDTAMRVCAFSVYAFMRSAAFQSRFICCFCWPASSSVTARGEWWGAVTSTAVFF